jgi:hypothetical protein
MMTTSVTLPPIIGPIMILVFVDLGLDISDYSNWSNIVKMLNVIPIYPTSIRIYNWPF